MVNNPVSLYYYLRYSYCQFFPSIKTHPARATTVILILLLFSFQQIRIFRLFGHCVYWEVVQIRPIRGVLSL